DEFAFADGSGKVHVLASHGKQLPGFPVETAASRYYSSQAQASGLGPRISSAIMAPLAAGDLEGKGKLYLVAASLEGHISALDHEGKMKPGFPITLPLPDYADV